MTPILGTLDRLADGSYQGLINALILRRQIELRPLRVEGGVRFFAVFAGDFEAGIARQAVRPADAPIDIVLASPDLPRALHARAVFAAAETFSIVWTDGA